MSTESMNLTEEEIQRGIQLFKLLYSWAREAQQSKEQEENSNYQEEPKEAA